MTKAKPSERYLAFLIDDIIFICVGMPIIIFIVPVVENTFFKAITFILLNLIFFLKDATGQSPGKYFLKIKIVKKMNSKKPSLLAIFIRNILACIWIIEGPMIFFDKNNERFGDKLTNSIVVKVEK